MKLLHESVPFAEIVLVMNELSFKLFNVKCFF